MARVTELKGLLAEQQQQVTSLQKALLARERRLILSRQGLHDTAARLEVLQMRSSWLDQAIETDSASVQLLRDQVHAKRSQAKHLQLRTLRQRLELGRAYASPQLLLTLAMGVWSLRTARRSEVLQRSRVAVPCWRFRAMAGAWRALRKSAPPARSSREQHVHIAATAVHAS